MVKSKRASLALATCLVTAACGTAVDPVADELPTPSVSITSAPVDLAECAADAQPGIDVAALAMASADEYALGELVSRAWTTTLAGDAAFDKAMATAAGAESTCVAPDIFSVVAIDRADEITPSSLNEAVIWLDTFGPLTEIARQVPPDVTLGYIEDGPAVPVGAPGDLEVEGIDGCDAIGEALGDHIDRFLGTWNAASPVDLARAVGGADLGNGVQGARLRAAEKGCNVLELAESALVQITTSASTSFVGRGQRLTYGNWLLDTMVAPYADPDVGVIAQPIGGPDGLTGYSVLNRTDAQVTGLTLLVEDDPLVEEVSLGSGESLWLPYAGGSALPPITLSWDR